MSEEIVTQDTGKSLDLSSFTVTLTISKAKKPTARLCFVGVPKITLNGTLANMVRKNLGEYVSVQVDPDAGEIALLKGNERKLMIDRIGSDVRKISVSTIADELTEIFGECRNIYFDPEVYDNAVLLVPNGRLVK